MKLETDAREFPSTRWSQLLALGGARNPEGRKALCALIERYWRPAYGYLRCLRHLGEEEGLELTQEFFARVIEKGRIGDLAPGRGSFRGYLKACLQNFSVSAARADRSRRPRDGQVFRFHLGRGEWQRLAPESGEANPEEIFDRAWAREVLSDGLRRCREVLEGEGKGEYFELFAAYYLEPIGFTFRGGAADDRVSHDALAKKYRRSASEVNNHLRYVRALLRRLLQERVAEYLGPGEDLEAELSFLLTQG